MWSYKDQNWGAVYLLNAGCQELGHESEVLCTRTVLFADISMYVSMLCHVMYVSISCYVRFYVRVYLQRNSNIERRAVSSFHSGAVSNVDHSPAHWQTGAAGGPIAGCRIHTQIQPLRFSNHFQDWQSGAMCKAHGSINKHLQTRGKYKLLHLSAYILYIYIYQTKHWKLDWTGHVETWSNKV